MHPVKCDLSTAESVHAWAVCKQLLFGAEGDTMCLAACCIKLYPLVTPLQSVFIDKDSIHLQMPFYTNGNLRTWVEQIKVALPMALCRM